MSRRHVSSRSVVVVAGAVATIALAASAWAQSPVRRPAGSSDDGAWHALSVPGGTFALESLGIPSSFPRTLALTEIVRRFSFEIPELHKLDAAVLELAASLEHLRHLQNAIALGSSPGKPMTLATARQRNARARLREAVEAAGFELREVKRELVVQERAGDEAARVRASLKGLGIDVDGLRKRLLSGGGFTIDVPTTTLPLPLSAATWNRVIFQREVPASQMFITLLTDPAARLLYHGLMGMDAETKRWLGSQPKLLEDLYRDPQAVRAFSLFGSALRVSNGQPVVPGGRTGARRWSALLDVDVTRAERFVQRLFTRESGRLSGLYFTLANADPSHQALMLGAADASHDSFLSLASGFSDCYGPEQIGYPFWQRPHDPASLLLDIEVTADGALAAPPWRRFWSHALDGDSLPDDPRRDLRDFNDDGTVDAAWLVDAICNARGDTREAVFETLLFAGRTFSGIDNEALPDALVAVRARRVYPGLMVAVEQAGIRRPRTYAALAHAAQNVSREGDPAKAITLLQQFQGVIALTLASIRSGTLSTETGSRLLESLAAVPVRDGRYDGRLANWFTLEWLPAVTASTAEKSSSGSVTAETKLALALAGAPGERAHVITWEGRAYVLDLADSTLRQLQQARQRQGGESLDTVIALGGLITALRASSQTLERVNELRTELTTIAPRLRSVKGAEEFGEDALDIPDRIADVLRDLSRIDSPRRLDRLVEVAEKLLPLLDFLFGTVIASWAYTPYVSGGDETTASAGDPSLRHEFGLRLNERLRDVRRWELGWRNNTGGYVSGALLGLDVALARFALRRMSTEGVPLQPVVSGNDLIGYQWTAALSDPRRLTDESRDRIAAALSAGAAIVAAAGRDPATLDAAIEKAAISPWRQQALSWTAAEEPERLASWFGVAELAAIGGLQPETVDAWGTASVSSGCLCLKMPRRRIPEALIGRPTAGALPHLSPDLMMRIAAALKERELPAPLASAVLRYAMREFIDRIRPAHAADLPTLARAATELDLLRIDDYISALAAVGPLRAATPREQP